MRYMYEGSEPEREYGRVGWGIARLILMCGRQATAKIGYIPSFRTVYHHFPTKRFGNNATVRCTSFDYIEVLLSSEG